MVCDNVECDREAAEEEEDEEEEGRRRSSGIQNQNKNLAQRCGE